MHQLGRKPMRSLHFTARGLGYMALSLLTAWYTDILQITIHETFRLHTFWLGLSIMSFLGLILVFLYLNYFLPWIMKLEIKYEQWRIYAPRAIPLAALCGTISSVSFIFAYWPVYKFLTPIYWYFLALGTTSLISVFG